MSRTPSSGDDGIPVRPQRPPKRPRQVGVALAGVAPSLQPYGVLSPDEITAALTRAGGSCARGPSQAERDDPYATVGDAHAVSAALARQTERRSGTRPPPCTRSDPLSAERLAAHLKDGLGAAGQCVHEEIIPARPARRARPRAALNSAARATLHSLARGAEPFVHQAAAIDALLCGDTRSDEGSGSERRAGGSGDDGRDSVRAVAIATSTCSGKSACFLVPVAQALEEDARSTFVLTFPTKALAQDQLRSARAVLGSALGWSAEQAAALVATYDGDSSDAERMAVRDHARVVLTNPDMFHRTILPNHRAHARLLSNLQLVVVDEAHAYSGVFGCHVALIIRRMRRIVERVHAGRPRFVLCSATMSEPSLHAAELTGLEESAIVCITQDGSPNGEKEFLLWNPPLVDVDSERHERVLERTRPGSRQSNGTSGRGGSVSDSDAFAGAGIDGSRPPSRQRTSAGTVTAGSNMLGLADDDEAMRGTSELDAVSANAAAAFQDLIALPGAELKLRARAIGVSQSGRKPDVAARVVAAEAARGTKRNAPAHGEEEERRLSSIVEISLLLAECVQHGVRTIAFCKSKKLAEMVLRYTRDTLRKNLSEEIANELVSKLRAYRGGYTPAERRSVEADLFSGRLLGVAATSALELGVDVGALDCTLHLGWPGSQASLWQQAGRAGRRQGRALSIMVAFRGPLDQWFMRNPKALFEGRLERVFADASAPVVLRAHLACAAFEHPITPADRDAFVGEAAFFAAAAAARRAGELGRPPADLTSAAQLALIPLGCGDTTPAAGVDIRAICDESFVVKDAATGVELESIEASKAFWTVYPGAVYYNQGREYICESLDLDTMVATARHAHNVGYYTIMIDEDVIEVEGGRRAYEMSNGDDEVLQACEGGDDAGAGDRSVPAGAVADLDATGAEARTVDQAAAGAPRMIVRCGSCTVTTVYHGYVKKWRSGTRQTERVDYARGSLPDRILETRACWVDVPEVVAAAIRAKYGRGAAAAGAHAAAHAIINAVPLRVAASGNDIGAECGVPDTPEGYGCVVTRAAMPKRPPKHARCAKAYPCGSRVADAQLRCAAVAQHRRGMSRAPRWRPTRILLYEKHQGGMGLAERVAEVFPQLVRDAHASVKACRCFTARGCPGCTVFSECTGYNKILHRRAGLDLLRLLLDVEAVKAKDTAA